MGSERRPNVPVENARARGYHELREGLTAAPGSKTQTAHAMPIRVEIPSVTDTRGGRGFLGDGPRELRRFTFMLDTLIFIRWPQGKHGSDKASNY